MRLILDSLRVLAVASTALIGGEADAATTFNLTIPASACQIETGGFQSAALVMVEGSWTIVSGDDGTATLWCPVPHAYLDAFTGEEQVIDAFRMWYRDGDGNGQASIVTAQLFRRSVTGNAPVPVDDVLSSTSSTATGNAQVTRDLADHTMLEQSYAFKVVLQRATPLDIVTFHGLEIFDDGT